MLNLWNGLVYTKILNDKIKRAFKIQNLELKVEDISCPIFIWSNLVEKRIFEIWKKNELIFSFSRNQFDMTKFTQKWVW